MRKVALARRLSIGVVDQVLSSGSNFVAMLLAARYLDTDGFGSFSVAMLSFTLTLGIARALCSEALLVRAGSTPDARARHVRQATGSVIWVGVLAAVGFAVLAVLASDPLDQCLVVLALAMPGLLLQDTLRYAAFARGEPKAAMYSDAFWFAGMLLILGALISQGTPSSPAMLLAFTVPGVVAGLLHAALERMGPARGGIAWILRNRDLSVRYALDFLSGAGAAQLAGYVLVLVSGVAAVGSIRGAQTLFGPVNILLTGVYIVLVPEGRHAARRSTRSLTVVCVAASTTFAVLAAVVLVGFLAISPSQGQAILGSTWPGAESVLVPVGLAAIAGGVMAGPSAGLRSLSAAQAILRIRLYTIPTTVALPVIGVIGWDEKGLAYGIAASVWWNVGWYWTGYFSALRGFDPASVDEIDVPDPDPGVALESNVTDPTAVSRPQVRRPSR